MGVIYPSHELVKERCQISTWAPSPKKVPNGLSRCHIKRRMGVAIFGMTPTFWEYNLWCQQSQILKSRCHTKRRMGAATWDARGARHITKDWSLNARSIRHTDIRQTHWISNASRHGSVHGGTDGWTNNTKWRAQLAAKAPWHMQYSTCVFVSNQNVCGEPCTAVDHI